MMRRLPNGFVFVFYSRRMSNVNIHKYQIVTLITVGQMNCKYFNYTLFYHIPIIFLIFNVISVDFCVSHGSSLMFSFGISQICISLIHGRTQNTSASFHRKAELLIQFSCFNRKSGYFWALWTARSCNKLVVG